MKTPETNRKHSPLSCPSALALFLALKNHNMTINPKQPATHKKKIPKSHISSSRQKPPAIARKPEKWIVLIINELTPKTHENTGKLSAIPEISNKPNMIRYTNKTPADRYKNAQPLMVPFDAEEESRKQNYKPQTLTHEKKPNSSNASAENQHHAAASSRRITA